MAVGLRQGKAHWALAVRLLKELLNCVALFLVRGRIYELRAGKCKAEVETAVLLKTGMGENRFSEPASGDRE